MNKHVSDGGDTGMEIFVLVVLCTEILLVLLTLLQTCYRTVVSEQKKQQKQLVCSLSVMIHTMSSTPFFFYYCIEFVFHLFNSRWQHRARKTCCFKDLVHFLLVFALKIRLKRQIPKQKIINQLL